MKTSFFNSLLYLPAQYREKSGLKDPVIKVAAQLEASAANLAAMADDVSLQQTMAQVVDLCVKALQKGNKLLFAGNGGSAADAQHLAGEMVARFNYDRPGLPALALTVDSSVMTAVSNDYGFEEVFRRQIQAVGRPGDVFFAISTSGRSPNVLAALRQAQADGLVTVGLTGRDGGEMPALCDHLLRAPADATPRIQESHIVMGHTICCLVEEALFPHRPGELPTSR